MTRDVTNGSRLSFRIRPGAPESSIDIAANGNIGFSESSPDTALHIKRSGTTAQLTFEDSSAGQSWVTGQSAANAFSIENISAASTTSMRFFTNGNLIVTAAGTAIMTVNAAGNLTIPGALSQGSNIHSKEKITRVDTQTVLDKISKLPISTWNYIKDEAGSRHMGPMAQEFYQNFGLGVDDKHISSMDTNGVALAGIQELIKQSEEKDKEIQVLHQKLARLETLVERMAALNNNNYLSMVDLAK